MTDPIQAAVQKKAARAAGLMFLFTTLVPLYYGAYLFPKLSVQGNGPATAERILSNEFLFRLGVVNELVYSIGAVAFAVILFWIFASFNRRIAIFAVLLKLMEATLTAVVALAHFTALMVLKEHASSIVFEPIQIADFVGLFINCFFDISTFNMTVHGLNLLTVMYLFFKSEYVPKQLAGFGIISYILLLLFALANTFAVDWTNKMIIQTVFMTPSIITELALGLWLIFNGLKGRGIKKLSINK